MDNPEKLATQGTQDVEKHNTSTTNTQTTQTNKIVVRGWAYGRILRYLKTKQVIEKKKRRGKTETQEK